MEFLNQEDIIFINRRTIERHGGNFVPPHNILLEMAAGKINLEAAKAWFLANIVQQKS